MAANTTENDLLSTDAGFLNGTDVDVDGPTASRNSLLDAVNTTIACLAVFGNGMVITVMLLRRRAFRSFTNRLMLHQSTIDFTGGVVFFFQQVVKHPDIPVSLNNDAYDHFVCRFVYPDALLWCMNVTSTYNIVVISLERFMATCYPVKYRNSWSRGKLKFTSLTVWSIGFIYGSHTALFHEPYMGHCRRIDLDLGLKIVHASVTIGTEYLIPISIMAYTYITILVMLNKKSVNPLNGQQQNVMSKAKKNVFMTTLLIGIMFAVCWTPIEVFSVDPDYFNGLSEMYKAFAALVGCNMFVNPIIYCFTYHRFRSQLRSLLCKQCRPNQVQDVEIFSVDSTANRNNGPA